MKHAPLNRQLQDHQTGPFMEIHSEPGAGTRVILTIPISKVG